MNAIPDHVAPPTDKLDYVEVNAGQRTTVINCIHNIDLDGFNIGNFPILNNLHSLIPLEQYLVSTMSTSSNNNNYNATLYCFEVYEYDHSSSILYFGRQIGTKNTLCDAFKKVRSSVSARKIIIKNSNCDTYFMWTSYKTAVVSEVSTMNSEFVCSNCIPEQLQYSLRLIQDSVMANIHKIGRKTSFPLIHLHFPVQTELTCSFIDLPFHTSTLDKWMMSLGLSRQPDRIIPRSQLVAERQQAVALVEKKVQQYCIDHQDEILKLLSEQESDEDHFWLE